MDAKISLCQEACYVFMFDYSMNTASKWCMEDVNVSVVVAIKWNESDVACSSKWLPGLPSYNQAEFYLLWAM
jgi:hypothetical protein